jgi:hypothetical protein
MVFDKSRMKHAEMAAHSSARSGGDRRVLDRPLAGVLQMIATATVLTPLSSDRWMTTQQG